jgi:hypothetical protein
MHDDERCSECGYPLGVHGSYEFGDEVGCSGPREPEEADEDERAEVEAQTRDEWA